MTKWISTYLDVYIAIIITNRYLILQLIIHIMESSFTNTTGHLLRQVVECIHIDLKSW